MTHAVQVGGWLWRGVAVWDKIGAFRRAMAGLAFSQLLAVAPYRLRAI